MFPFQDVLTVTFYLFLFNVSNKRTSIDVCRNYKIHCFTEGPVVKCLLVTPEIEKVVTKPTWSSISDPT